MTTLDKLSKNLIATYQKYGDRKNAEGAPKAICHAEMR